MQASLTPTAPVAARQQLSIAIIAHVDHGKTTLVDGLLKTTGALDRKAAEGELILDSNPLERERGITITSKMASFTYAGVKVDLLDTPGHADFAGEVERVIGLADACLLLVDAAEGPLPGTRFVLQKAFEHGLRPIVVINKIDRKDARAEEVLELIHDLFLDLATDAEQLDFPVVYTIAREARSTLDLGRELEDLTPLLDTIVKMPVRHSWDAAEPFQFRVAALDYDDFRGRYAIGRIVRGRLAPGQAVARLHADGTSTSARVKDVFVNEGLGRAPVEEATAGEIVALTGIADVMIGETLADPDAPEALPPLTIEEPTVRITIGVNTSPFAGRSGKVWTGRQIGDRLRRELETNVALSVEPTDSPEVFLVSGRGELHLSVLIETLRREGGEFQVSRPEAILRTRDGVREEPYERVLMEIPDGQLGWVTDNLARRLGRMVDLGPVGDGSSGRVRVTFEAPTRGLIGLRGQFLTATRGEGWVASTSLGYRPYAGEIAATRNGSLIASDTGQALAYGIGKVQERGATFIEPGTEVYEGMIVGVHSRENDLVVNIAREKKQTNIRSSTADIAVKLAPPVLQSLEESLDFLAADELLEVTPAALRLRKRHLSIEARNKAKSGR